MNVNRMKKRILLLLLVIPALIKAQDVMTETRQELTSPDGAYRFTFYQRAVGEDNAQMYYTLTYKNRPVIEESKLGVLKISYLNRHWVYQMILVIFGVRI